MTVHRNRLVTTLAVILLVGATVGVAPASAASAGLTGGGAQYPEPELLQWGAGVAQTPYSLTVGYQAMDSIVGRQKYLTGELDFAVTDLPFQFDEQQRVANSPRKSFVYVPVSAVGIGFMYNVVGLDGRRITNLRLSQRAVCRLFTEEEIYWDDSEVATDNPGVPLPHSRVRPVARADDNGNTYQLSEFCISTSPDLWAAFIGRINQVAPATASSEFQNGRPTDEWPSGYGKVGLATGSKGVADTVANEISGTSTIGYVEPSYAAERGFPTAAVRNGAGVFTTPSVANVANALEFTVNRSDGRVDFDYLASGPAVYFPVSISYVIAQTNGFDPAKGLNLATFLNYAVTTGQDRANPLGFARLPSRVIKAALDRIATIPGAPPRPPDPGTGPPPPPPPPPPASRPIGGGASYPQVAIEKWRAVTNQPPYRLDLDYRGASSTFGLQRYITGELDYAVSDLPFQPNQQQQVANSPRNSFVYVPLTAGGLAFTYNLTSTDGTPVTNLRLSPRTVCRLFTENEIYWDDPDVAGDNGPSIRLPHDRVRPIARSDDSGTSSVLAEFCIANAPAVWASFVTLIAQTAPETASPEFLNGQPTPRWPSRYGAVAVSYASEGLANDVRNRRSTIGYVEAHYATERGMPSVAIRNTAGAFTTPAPPNVTAAFGHATSRADGTLRIDYLSPDPAAYFPVVYSLAIAQTTGFDSAKGFNLASFLNYAVTTGQNQIESLPGFLSSEPVGYGRLPAGLVSLALDRIAQIPGAPPRPPDPGGAPDPVVPEAPLAALFPITGLIVLAVVARSGRRRLTSSKQ